MERTTLYYDGACPLCRAEIAQYERQDEAGALTLIDVSDPDTALPLGADRAQLLARFHAAGPDGQLVSGAAAFVAVWQRLPGWRLLARVAQIPGVTPVLEGAYRVFLPLRPMIVAGFVALRRLRGGSDPG